MDRHALVRRPRAHGVNRIRTRSEPAKPPQASFGLPHAWIHSVRPRTSRRKGKHDLPNPGCAIVRVLRKEFVQKGGTTPRHPGNENGPFNDRSIQGLRLPAPRVSQLQSSLEQLPQVNPHEKTGPNGCRSASSSRLFTRIESAGSIGGSPKSSSPVRCLASAQSASLCSNHSRRLKRSPKRMFEKSWQIETQVRGPGFAPAVWKLEWET